MNICHICSREYNQELVTLADGRECCGCVNLVYSTIKDEFRLCTPEEQAHIEKELQKTLKLIQTLRQKLEEQCDD